MFEWASKVSKKYVSKDISHEIHEKAAPFITWLKEAEEEESDSEDDDEDEDDDVEVKFLFYFTVNFFFYSFSNKLIILLRSSTMTELFSRSSSNNSRTRRPQLSLWKKKMDMKILTLITFK